MEALVLVVAYLVQFLAFAIFARAMLTWFPIDKEGPIFRTLNAITDPVLDPLRRVIPPIGALDLTPMIAMIALFFMANVLFSYS
ncbi:MAG: YggT family protein [Dehalococcoidia bacterium]|nr:YggT family protein [Dehalococcoidia bacterium]